MAKPKRRTAREKSAALDALAAAVSSHLSGLGPCEGVPEHSHVSTCRDPLCTYCGMARALGEVERIEALANAEDVA